MPTIKISIVARRPVLHVSSFRIWDRLDALDLAATGDPDNRLNKFVMGCSSGERLELLLREVVAHQVHISGLVVSFGRKAGVDSNSASLA